MPEPATFADQAEQIGITLPEAVLLAVDRVRAFDRAIGKIAADPLNGIDVTAIAPQHIGRRLHDVIHAENLHNARYGNAVQRFRAATVHTAQCAIREHADNIVTAMRAVHDPLAAQLADNAAVLGDLDPAALANTDADTRERWAEQSAAWRQLRAIHGLRFQLAEWGHRLRRTDLLGRDLEVLSRYVNVPTTTSGEQLIAYYQHAEQRHWGDLLRAGCHLWLPTLAEQDNHMDMLRTIHEHGGQRSARIG